MAVINYLEDLISMSLNGTHELARDLDFQDDTSYSNLSNKLTWTTGTGFPMIGNLNNRFTGIFDGNNYSIKNLFINKITATYLDSFGLFSVIGTGGNIRNLKLINPDITGTGTELDIGCIAGYSYGTAIIDNVHIINGIVKGGYIAGIICNMNDSSSVRNCSFDGILQKNISSGDAYSGGIAGEMSGTCNIHRCKTTGSITSTGTVGYGNAGILATVWGGTTLIISDCYSEMTIPNINNSALIVGYRNNGTITIRYCWTNKASGNYTIIRTGTVTSQNNFFDQNTTSISTSTGATGRTTIQMKTLDTFSSATWNIAPRTAFVPDGSTYWFIDENNDYPRLWWEYVPLQITNRRRSSMVNLLMN